jgi:hypothetical protein
MVESWFQLLQHELEEHDDDHLWHWPVEWWKQLLREGMDPAQAVRYTTRVMYNGRKPKTELRAAPNPVNLRPQG